MSSPEKIRSVLDYDNEESLKRALMMMPPPLNKTGSQSFGDEKPDKTATLSSLSPENNMKKPAVTGMNGEALVGTENLDWVLPSSDPETTCTEAQSMKEELHRLLVLKSYLILDAEREASFDRITRMGGRIYNVPICLVSLVDLGRQWFMSNRGLGDVRQTPRKHAFCAHAILDKSSVFVVPDATTDFRFKDNPLVTSNPHIRFYAGSPLISPEGYKLGTFCIIDSNPRPGGLTDSEKETLQDLSDTVVQEMVSRRHKLVQENTPSNQLIAYTAHDLLTPLSGVQLSLTLLKEDDQVQSRLGTQQLELLNTASNCSDLMIRICKTAMESLRSSGPSEPSTDANSTSTGVTSTLTKMAELTKSLLMILEPTPKRVPLIITVAPNTPAAILCDDLKLFRSALNLLTSALARTRYGKVHLTICVVPGKEPIKHEQDILFECEDTASNIDVELYPLLFQPSRPQDGDLRMSLSSVALLINSLDGNYGFRPSNTNADGIAVQGNFAAGSVFWFRVPLVEAPDKMLTKSTSLGQISVLQSTDSLTALAPSRSGPLKMPMVPAVHFPRRSTSSTSMFRQRVNSTGFPFEVFATPNVNMQNSTFDKSPASAKEGNVKSAFAQILNRSSSRKRKDAPSTSSTPRRASLEPAAPKKDKAVPVEMRLWVPPRQKKALVIEDTTVVRKTLARALTKLGYSVSQAVDGSEGLDALKLDVFDVTLCDFLMPVMDGMDCVKQYRAWEKVNRPNLRLLIVGISAHANANDSNRGIKVGMDKYWPKPVTIKKLAEFQESQLALMSFEALDKIWQMENDVAVSQQPRQNSNEDRIIPTPPDGGATAKASTAPAPSPSYVSNVSSHDEVHKSTPTLGPPAERGSDADMPHPRKRRRSSSEEEEDASPTTTKVCLIGTRNTSAQSNAVISDLESKGWKVLVVHDGKDALRLLQMRNYDVVLLDDNMPIIDAHACMSQFRSWEDEYRVNRQKNTFMVCSADVPSPLEDRRSIIQPPSAFDNVLRDPVAWNDLQYLLNKHKTISLEIIHR